MYFEIGKPLKQQFRKSHHIGHCNFKSKRKFVFFVLFTGEIIIPGQVYLPWPMKSTQSNIHSSLNYAHSKENKELRWSWSMVKQLVPPWSFHTSVGIIAICFPWKIYCNLFCTTWWPVVSHSFYAHMYEQGIKILFLTLTFSSLSQLGSYLYCYIRRRQDLSTTCTVQYFAFFSDCFSPCPQDSSPSLICYQNISFSVWDSQSATLCGAAWEE